MARKFNVYGIGNAIVDIQLSLSEEKFKSLGLEKGGMKLVEPEVQQKLLSGFKDSELHQASGGSAANSMIALTQLGGNAAYGCLVADDDFGRFYETEMKELGVTLYTTRTPEGETGSSVILITPDAERTMNTYLGVSADFGPEYISSKLVSESDWIFIEGYLFSTIQGQEAVKRILTYAGKSGTKVALVFSDVFIVEAFKQPLQDAVQYADLIFANFNEAASFTGESEEQNIFDALEKMSTNFVFTKGSEGSVVCFGGKRYDIQPVAAEAVDETGAGDMFAGAFLYGISTGFSPQAAGDLASKLASNIVSQLGPRLLGDLEAKIVEAKNSLGSEK